MFEGCKSLRTIKTPKYLPKNKEAVIKLELVYYNKAGQKRTEIIDTNDVYEINERDMYRLYNPNSGEHFYTASEKEKEDLVAVGWKYEGYAWKAPKTSKTPVYRLYNPNAGDHHYTTSVAEKNNLVTVGWNYEGIGWYSDDKKGVPLYRLYNPNAKAGAHHYTTSINEKNNLMNAGWKYEGLAWYGMK